MWHGSRRDFLRTGAAAIATAAAGRSSCLLAQIPGDRPVRDDQVAVLNPRGRVPVGLIIDDSTCLVNMGHYCMPQFAEAWPGRKDYQKPWQTFPREIPDAFVRKFGEWCAEHGVKGKYSVVPYPACVGWLDRDLPGWSHRALRESIALVRSLMVPSWDIHPEMISHTWAIDTRTGRPYDERTPDYMENWGFSVGKSAAELTDYLGYALRILKNIDLPCEGVTTPGGFGSQSRPALAQATLDSCRDVYQTEIPHYFRDLFTDERSVAPLVQYASGLDGPDPKCVVSIIGCTGDWFGGWDGTEPGDVDQFITADLAKGRMVDVIERGEPAIMVCHWPGIYFNGQEVGFKILGQVVQRLHARYEHLLWMKLSEVARYWAAKELTRIERDGAAIKLQAPFAAPAFTLRVPSSGQAPPRLTIGDKPLAIAEVGRMLDLQPGTWTRDGQSLVVCFDLPKGPSRIDA